MSNAFDFKGVEVGAASTPKEIREQLGLTCYKKMNGQVCRGATTVAGQKTYMKLKMDSSGIVQAMLIPLKADDFAAIENALTSKFGDPETKERKPIQNRHGTSYEQIADRWSNDKGDYVLLTKYFGHTYQSMLMFGTLSKSDAMETESLVDPNDL
jgi:hypothetical protein